MQNFVVPQSAIACSKLTIEETLEQGVKYTGETYFEHI